MQRTRDLELLVKSAAHFIASSFVRPSYIGLTSFRHVQVTKLSRVADMPAKETLWSGTSTYTNHCQALLHLTSLKASGHTWHKTRWNDGIFAHSNDLRRGSLYAAHTGMKDLMALGRVAPSPPSIYRARLSTSTGK